MTESAVVLFVLGAIVFCADWLERRPVGRLVGGAIIALLLGMLLANLGLIPTASGGPALYGYLIGIGAPVSIFLLLLAYHIAFWTWKGTTVGGIICQLRVVRIDGV